MIDRTFFEGNPLVCARSLIGCELVWGETSGVIVETEAYAEHGDAASHTSLRRGTRDFIQKNPAGTLYVYLNYGVHWLLNFLVKGREANGFILIRALEPTRGIELMAERRDLSELHRLCSGPGKLTQALAINQKFHGRDFFGIAGTRIWRGHQSLEIDIDRRVGITKAVDFDWRFLLSGSGSVSIPKRKTRLRTD
jgi:DNA-3-methyladenine glycosylase